MESKGDSNTKVLDSLKKILKDLTEQQDSKYHSSKQTNSSLNELTEAVCNTTVKNVGNNPQLIPSTIELLVYAYGNVDQDVRLCASENLRKLIKAMMGIQLFKIQQSLFHELKKNGTARSVCIALECFSALFPRTRPQKCHNLSHQFYLVLSRIIDRDEEIIHERLLESLPNILPSMTPFLSSQQVQSLMSLLSQNLPKSSASYRRMMASAISLLCVHSKVPVPRTDWIIAKLIAQASTHTSSQYVLQGVLLSFYQLLLNFNKCMPSLSHTKQMYCLCISAMVYGEQNTINTALEVIEQLLQSASTEFDVFLSTSSTGPSLAPNLWMTDHSESFSQLDEKSETGSQLDAPLELYFDMEDSMDGSTAIMPSEARITDSITPTPQKSSLHASLLHPSRSSPTSSIDSWAASSVSLTDDSCFTSLTSSVPLQDLVEYIINNILTHKRVSIQSVGLACLSSSLNIQATLITDLSVFNNFLLADDPKLVSRMATLLSSVIVTELRTTNLNFDSCRPLVSFACDKLYDILGSEVATILKAACESLQLCLPLLLSSTRPIKGVKLLKKLMNLIEVNYWLLKVELLETLAVIDYAQLAIVESSLLSQILNEVVFPLVRDTDHRVRTAVSNTLMQLAKTLDTADKPLPLLAVQHVKTSFDHLYAKPTQLSLAGIGRTDSQIIPSIPTCLEVIVWHCMTLLSSSEDQIGQKGALEVLCRLSEEYPPPTLPSLWGVNGSQCGLLELLLQLFRGSWLSWHVQTHTQLLQLCTCLFLACALDSLHQAVNEGHGWDKGMERVGVVRHATTLLLHLLKLLNVFQHVIDNRDLEDKETKNVILKKMETLSPKSKTAPSDHTHVPPKEMIGNTSGSPQYQKLYDSLSAAYTNYQVSINPSSDDKFTLLLVQLHNCLASVLEVSLVEEVGRHVEEIIGYLMVTVKVDAPGALLCVQQLLNSLFGLNVAMQQTHVYSPFLCSLPYTLKAPPTTTPTESLVDTLVKGPLHLMYLSLKAPISSSTASPSRQQLYPEKKVNKLWLFGTKNEKSLKAPNALASIKEYLVHFEGLVVYSIRHFAMTSSIIVQERVLFMMVQLLHLKVNYKMLDCNNVFVDSVNRQVSLMESGNVEGGASLVPHLFQFLVMLATDSRLVSIPEVIQKCDSVMASGKNVATFAVPALRPLVMHLFMKPIRKLSQELSTQREVTLNMLLRLVFYPSVIDLLICVLECYQHNAQEWVNTSSLVYAFLLAPIGRLLVELDSMSAISSLHHLFATMTPSTISIQTLVVAQMKQTKLSSPLYLTRWLAVLTCTLRLMYSIFPEDRFFAEIEGMDLVTPSVNCNGVQVFPDKIVDSMESPGSALSLAGFLLDTIMLSVKCIMLLLQHGEQKGIDMLANVTTDIMILITTLIEKDYPLLKSSLATLTPPETLLDSLTKLAHSYPLLQLHFMNVLVSVWSNKVDNCMRSFLCHFNTNMSPNQQLVLHSLIPLVPRPELWAGSLDPALLYDYFGGADLIEFTKKACLNDTFRSQLKSFLLSLQLTSVTDCIKVISLIRCLKNGSGIEEMKLIAEKLITHPVRGINKEAESLLLELLPSRDPSPSELQEIMNYIEPCRRRIPKLWTIIKTMEGTFSPVTIATYDPLNEIKSENLVMEVNKEWQKTVIQDVCLSYPLHVSFLTNSHSYSSLTFSDLLVTLPKQDISNIITNDNFPTHLLEECIVQSILFSLVKQNSGTEYSTSSITTPTNYESLISVCIEKLFCCVARYIQDDSNQTLQFDSPYITRSLVWLFMSWSQVIPNVSLLEDMADNCVLFAEIFLRNVYKTFPVYDSIALEAALDLCSLILQMKAVASYITSEWVCSVTATLTLIVEKEYSLTPTDIMEYKTGIEMATEQLRWLFAVLLTVTPLDSSPFIHTLTISLSRLSLFSNAITIPPLLIGMGESTVTERMLDKSLNDSDILIEYMQRINSMGWSSKSHFEERWMQLLGVLNTAPPHEEMPLEEHLAHNMSLCTALRSATSILRGISLRPFAGNPIWSIHLHTHRNKDFNFLSSPAGKKLLPCRSLIESQIILDSAVRPNCHARYQIPLKHEVLTQTYPSVFCQNIERPIGSSDLTLCQLSYTSLLPIILKTEVVGGSTIDGIDMRSCIISLIELFAHWFTQPMDLLLLHHTLTSIIMLSDLFFLSNQFDWMLSTFLNVYQTHPSEDLLSEPMIVFGILKAAGILRVDALEAEKIAKVVEQSLSSDVFINSQNACLEGMLFLVENAESAILSLVGPAVARYILSHLDRYQNYSEHHILLVWSLGTHLALLQSHSQPTKDPNYTTHLLELCSTVLCDPRTSSRVARAIFLGLEHLVLSFSVSSTDKSIITQLAAGRFMKSDQSKSTSALALLFTCMYTGEEADRVSGLTVPQENMENLKESVYQSREHISNLLERLRHGNETEVDYLIKLLPGVVVDFLPPMDAMNTVVTEVISQQQTRPWMAAIIMAKTFELLIQIEMDPAKPSSPSLTVIDWVLLSLDSFIQQEPERHAVWCITCLLIAGSSNPILRAVYPIVVHKMYSDEDWLDKMLCTASCIFYNQTNFPQEEKRSFIEKFQKSQYPILHRLVHCLK